MKYAIFFLSSYWLLQGSWVLSKPQKLNDRTLFMLLLDLSLSPVIHVFVS